MPEYIELLPCDWLIRPMLNEQLNRCTQVAGKCITTIAALLIGYYKNHNHLCPIFTNTTNKTLLFVKFSVALIFDNAPVLME